MVRITMEDGGIIDIELNEEVAPITCENFKKLVKEGFYNGLTNLFFRALQTVSIATMIVQLLLPVAIVAAIYLLWRIARNLEKPPKLTEEVKIVRKSLSEMLKENRTRCKMTQEFVAETIGVSRQAVSKWENGTSEPNTTNLMALARLYGIPAEDLLKGVESALEAEKKE